MECHVWQTFSRSYSSMNWVELICEDTYSRRDKCIWAYNPTSHVESTWGHVKGVDPWHHTLWELTLVFLEGVASRSPHGSAMCDKHSPVCTPMWIELSWYVRTLIQEGISGTLIRKGISRFGLIVQHPVESTWGHIPCGEHMRTCQGSLPWCHTVWGVEPKCS